MKQNRVSYELEKIVQTLAQFKQGVSLEALKHALDLDIEIRTLQRRLEKLKEEGLVVASGKGRAITYQVAASIASEVPNAQLNLTADIPLSEEGRGLLQKLSLPQHLRRPVGYNAAFLTDYRPNVDYYLSLKERHKLAELGQTNRLNQPAGTYAKEILQRLLIDLSWNSSRLEGNTYSLLDTQRLISQGKLADHRSVAEAQMILNHKDAIEFIVQTTEEIDFNYYTLTNLHAMLSNNLLPDPAASGRLRTFGVGITNSVFTPLAMPQLIDEFFRVMLSKAQAIEDPFEQAFFIMVQLPYLQPFDDVNKRVSRLAANIPLNRHNLAPLAFVDVPNHLYVQGLLGIYELNQIELFKDVFLWAYERSALRYAAVRQSLGEPDTFRLEYREDVRSLISEIITGGMSQQEAAKKIQEAARKIPEADQARFIETVDTELLALHEGNYARYRVRPSEYIRWREIWEKE
ncbi:Fic family protein [Siphonobacter sp. SORGH_AS_0500]|uniref:Fic family protein n=1 Tax=Siphonobacter sp. SORGH_AS_0500 TaxID=1864824 RepID=UPI00286269C5|nr:Fic family protein [Siphonobacter sp. SORGH_AS_0500]MDR6197392.1 Fic family protein [Siphonobacter sp. SORGH_AS_0500]